jgi:hypothetical protein
MTALALHDVEGWTCEVWCGPTAVCAVTGRTTADVLKAPKSVNPEIIDLRSTAPRDWGKTLKSFGVTWSEQRFEELFEDQLDIETHLERFEYTQPTLVLAFRKEGTGDGHVFATCRGMVVDSYTGGKIASFDPTKLPEELRQFRVKYVLHLKAAPNKDPLPPTGP